MLGFSMTALVKCLRFISLLLAQLMLYGLCDNFYCSAFIYTRNLQEKYIIHSHRRFGLVHRRYSRVSALKLKPKDKFPKKDASSFDFFSNTVCDDRQRRRWVFRLLSSPISFGSFLLPLLEEDCNAYATISTNIDDAISNKITTQSSVCDNGALALESSVPGAYQQVCMDMPVREITIQLPALSSLNSKDGSIVATDSASNNSALTEKVLRIEQDVSRAGATGMAVWNSSLLLTRLLERLEQISFENLQSPFWFSSIQSAVELGCGPGLASLALASLKNSDNKPFSVLATDGNADIVALAKRNVERNNLTGNVKAVRLQWSEMPTIEDEVDVGDNSSVVSNDDKDSSSNNSYFDLVMGSDLTYNAGSWRVLAATMAALIKPDTGYVLYVTLGHAGFVVQAETQGFLSVAQQMGLQVVPTNEAVPSLLTENNRKSRRSLTDILLQDCVRPEERNIVETTGGAQAILLRKITKKKFV